MTRVQGIPPVISQTIVLRFVRFAIDSGIGKYELTYKRQMPKVIVDDILKHLVLIGDTVANYSKAYDYLEDIWRYVVFDANHWISKYGNGVGIKKEGKLIAKYGVKYSVDNSEITVNVTEWNEEAFGVTIHYPGNDELSMA